MGPWRYKSSFQLCIRFSFPSFFFLLRARFNFGINRQTEAIFFCIVSPSKSFFRVFRIPNRFRVFCAVHSLTPRHANGIFNFASDKYWCDEDSNGFRAPQKYTVLGNFGNEWRWFWFVDRLFALCEFRFSVVFVSSIRFGCWFRHLSSSGRVSRRFFWYWALITHFEWIRLSYIVCPLAARSRTNERVRCACMYIVCCLWLWCWLLLSLYFEREHPANNYIVFIHMRLVHARNTCARRTKPKRNREGRATESERASEWERANGARESERETGKKINKTQNRRSRNSEKKKWNIITTWPQNIFAE